MTILTDQSFQHHTSTGTQDVWIWVKTTLGLMVCGIIFYARLFYPFHTAVALSVFFAAALYCCYKIFLTPVVNKRFITVLTAAWVIICLGYAAFEYHAKPLHPVLVPDYYAMHVTPVENLIRKTTAPVYDTLMKIAADIKIRPSRYQIHPTQTAAVKSLIEPGDIILLRKNNYLSNWVIPGFWKHAALYCGSLDEINRYFSDASRQPAGFRAFDHISQHMPAAFEKMFASPNPVKHAVIESTTRGVVITPLDESIQSDHLIILRPRVSKEKKLAAVLYGLSQYSKPYDFLYDFSNDQALCCSELIYRAYFSHAHDGPSHDYQLIRGRWAVIPDDFAEAFEWIYQSKSSPPGLKHSSIPAP